MILTVLAAAAVILSAPFVGQLRAALRAAFPGRFVTIVGGAVALAIAAAIAIVAITGAAAAPLSAYHR